jgi:GDP-4-dehydro-6-deoxy-D-mannose reductase
MRVLVTGGNGFVGRHLLAELRARSHDAVSAAHGVLEPGDIAFDLGDLANVKRVVERARPDIIFHLAAHASVAQAASSPLETYRANVLGTAYVVEALREYAPAAKLLFVGSAEVYGAHAAADLPLRETTLPSPATIYAASKLAAEALVLASARTYGIRAVAVRPFNIIGPGQSDRFVVGAFSHRLAAIAVGGPALFPVGNLTAQRDFIDVRDAVRAFADVAERGADGEIYNVCSGRPTGVADLLRQLVFAARVGVEIREDPSLMRSVDVPLAYGDATKLREATGWEPAIPLQRTLRDAYAAALESARSRAGVLGGMTANEAGHGG